MSNIFNHIVSGSRIVYANGDVKIALLGTEYGDILTSRDRRTYANLDEYAIDGTYCGDCQYDIIEISNPKNKFRYLSPNAEDYEVVWQKKRTPVEPPKIMLTMAEIRDLIGEDFVICG